MYVKTVLKCGEKEKDSGGRLDLPQVEMISMAIRGPLALDGPPRCQRQAGTWCCLFGSVDPKTWCCLLAKGCLKRRGLEFRFLSGGSVAGFYSQNLLHAWSDVPDGECFWHWLLPTWAVLLILSTHSIFVDPPCRHECLCARSWLQVICRGCRG